MPKYVVDGQRVCAKGHPLTDDNLVPSMRHLQRRCRICDAAWRREHKRQKRRAAGAPERGPAARCKRGHPMSGDNLHVKPDGRRTCRTCNRDRARDRNRANGATAAKRLTRAEKLTQRRKWEATRRARKRGAFVEAVDPLVVYDRGHGACGICGRAVTRDEFEVDHIVPLARGGEHSYANVQPAHPRCNRRKWARHEEATAA